MVKKLKRIIRSFIIKKLVHMVSEIVSKYEHDEFDKTTKQLKTVGDNVTMKFPFMILEPSYISIGNNFRALSNCRLQVVVDKTINVNPEILIGNNVSIESNCHIGAVNQIVIEDGVMIASNVFISDHFHGEISKNDFNLIPDKRPLTSKGPIIIHKNVWIGDSVCILPGVVIGENAIIGANAVITKDVPANSVVAGVPAIVIKQL